MPLDQRPREKAIMQGMMALSDIELLALLIRNGFKNNSVLTISKNLLSASKGIGSLSKMSMQDLCRIKGIKQAKALELCACFELARRVTFQKALNVDVVDNPKYMIRWLQNELGSFQQEHFMVVFLNIKNHILGYKILFIGTVDTSLVHPREIYREAMNFSASRIIAIHNHPSADLTPSQADKAITAKLIEVGELVGIELLDHLIVSQNRFYSFRGEFKENV